MKVAENPHKVRNIVEGSFLNFRRLYEKSFKHNRDLFGSGSTSATRTSHYTHTHTHTHIHAHVYTHHTKPCTESPLVVRLPYKDDTKSDPSSFCFQVSTCAHTPRKCTHTHAHTRRARTHTHTHTRHTHTHGQLNNLLTFETSGEWIIQACAVLFRIVCLPL